MGNAQSGSVYRKLSKELPPVKQMDHSDDRSEYKDFGMKVFADDKDREQFIHAVIAVATSNGLTDLNDHDFRLLYSRRANDDSRIIARIVAIKDGVIKAKIEPGLDGQDQTEAFKALRRDVEIKLDRILETVPDSIQGESSSAAGASAGGRRVGVDAPPAYGSPNIGGVSGKKG